MNKHTFCLTVMLLFSLVSVELKSQSFDLFVVDGVTISIDTTALKIDQQLEVVIRNNSNNYLFLIRDPLETTTDKTGGSIFIDLSLDRDYDYLLIPKYPVNLISVGPQTCYETAINTTELTRKPNQIYLSVDLLLIKYATKKVMRKLFKGFKLPMHQITIQDYLNYFEQNPELYFSKKIDL